MKLIALALIGAFTMAAPALAKTFATSAGEVEVTRIGGAIERPWALGFLPDQSMIVTLREGALIHVTVEGTMSEITGVPRVKVTGQGGLLDIAIAPDFLATREIYLTYSEPVGVLSARTALGRGRLSEDRKKLEGFETIFRMSDSSRAPVHFGSRIVFAEDGKTLWVTLGDRGDREEAQNLAKHNGKVIRLNRDGSVPEDNPFVGQAGAQLEIWSIGHRNPQGATRRDDGALVTISHGARGGDEVNVPLAGRNYGWPVISYGTHYSGAKIGLGSDAAGMEQPLWYWDPSIAPSGAAFLSTDRIPEWKGSLFVGALRGQMIARLEAHGEGYREVERLFVEEFGRVRDVREGPDGVLWFVTDDVEGGIYRVDPR